MASSANPLLSLVIPVYNEAEALPRFIELVEEALKAQENNYEIIFVNDGSSDDSLDILLGYTDRNSVVVIDLARNFGKEAAVTCGLSYARGDAVIIMDADLQHPVSLIPELLEKWREGYEMVVPRNVARENESAVYRWLAHTFYRVIHAIGTIDIPPGASDFRLLDRKVVSVICHLPERNRFMKGIYAWPGFSVFYLPYNTEDRYAGTSKWRPWQLWNLALDGIFSFSAAPLRIWTYLGCIIALVAFLWAFKIGVSALIYGIQVVPGVTTVAILVLFTLGLLMVQGGIQGEYIARIFEEVKGRPLYVVRGVYRDDQS